jgi:hypothetical protein
LTVSRRINERDRFACSSLPLVLDTMAELRLAADEGLVDLDHSRQLTGNALSIIGHLADRMAGHGEPRVVLRPGPGGEPI